jgi:general secretion pathway protein C
MARFVQLTTHNLLGALNLVLVVLCAYVAARVVHNIRRSDPGQINPPIARPVFQSMQPPRSFAYYQPILDRNLFKSNLEDKKADEGEVPDVVEESPLQAKLIATVVTRDESKSSATIEDQTNQKREIYHLKETVMNEAQVVKIERERVIVLRNGKHESLSLYEPVAPGATPGSPGARSAANPYNQIGQAMQPGITAPQGGLRGLQPQVRTMPGVGAQRPRVAELNAVTKFNSQNSDFRVMPHFQQGRIDGFRVFSLSTSSKWAQAGLRNGDVVRSVNDMPLSSVQQFYEAIQRTKDAGAGDIRVEIQRGTNRQVITYRGES